MSAKIFDGMKYRDGKSEKMENQLSMKERKIITSVKFVDGSVVFIMEDGKELTPGNISEVLSGSADTNSLVEASMLIGKTVG